MPKPTVSSEMEELQKLRDENAKLKAENASKQQFTLKVSEKGAVSVYGLGRFPATFYVEQWELLLSKADDIRAFIAANQSSLKRKER